MEIIRTTSLSWHTAVSVPVLFLGFICRLCHTVPCDDCTTLQTGGKQDLVHQIVSYVSCD